MFNYFDRNGDGKLDKGELLEVLKMLLEVDLREDKAVIGDFFEKMDSQEKKDQLISFKEFQAWIQVTTNEKIKT